MRLCHRCGAPARWQIVVHVEGGRELRHPRSEYLCDECHDAEREATP